MAFMSESIAVLGAGNGGCAIAGHLSFVGHKVRLYEIPELEEGFRPILEGEAVTMCGKAEEGVVRLDLATTDIRSAVSGASTIIITVPAFGYGPMAERLVPHLEDGQLVAFIPGCFASILFLEEMRRQGVERDVTLAESATLPYAARLSDRTTVSIAGTSCLLPVGVFPAERTATVIPKLQAWYPVIVAAKDVLDIALSNLNPVTHPAPVIMSTSSVEGSDDFHLYRDGITDGVKRVMMAMDRERIEVRETCGYRDAHYGYHQFEPFEVFEDFFGKGCIVETGYKLKGPSSMTDRYITDDVPYGLVLFSSLGRKAGVKTPVCDAIIQLASTVNGEDYRETGLDFERTFVGTWPLDDFKAYLATGRAS